MHTGHRWRQHESFFNPLIFLWCTSLLWGSFLSLTSLTNAPQLLLTTYWFSYFHMYGFLRPHPPWIISSIYPRSLRHHLNLLASKSFTGNHKVCAQLTTSVYTHTGSRCTNHRSMVLSLIKNRNWQGLLYIAGKMVRGRLSSSYHSITVLLAVWYVIWASTSRARGTSCHSLSPRYTSEVQEEVWWSHIQA